MKKFKKIAYIFVFIIIILLIFMIYSSVAKDSEPDIRDKVFSEIEFFESKLIYMFNSLNNIEFENYKISTEDISAKSKESSQSSTSAGNGGDSKTENQGSEQSSSSEESSSTSQNSDSLDETKKYSLNIKGVLSSAKEINWEYIKNESELLDDSISTMTLDLYEISLNNADILKFNKEYDNLLISIKNENKQDTLNQLSILYSYIPKFIKNCNKDEQYEIIVNTKSSIFNAYAILDTDDWDSMSKYIQSANESFSKLLTNINIKNKNQYTVNKCYIDLNSLQNSIEMKDKEIFLIKYRNLLEDLNNL